MTRKSLSSPYEQVKEFNDFQFNYFPFKSEKRFHFMSVYIDNPGHDICIYSTLLHWAQSTPFAYSINR